MTGIGEVESKVVKNQRKTFGTLRDLLRVKSTGIIEHIPDKGIVKYAKPVGVVGARAPDGIPLPNPFPLDTGGQVAILATSDVGELFIGVQKPRGFETAHRNSVLCLCKSTAATRTGSRRFLLR